MVNRDKIYYNTYTGNHSESTNEIYYYSIVINLIVFITILLTVFIYKKYIIDLRLEGKYEL